MIDKKTFVLAVAVSWALTLVTVLLISNFAPSLTQPFTQQFVSQESVKVVNLQKNEVMNMQDMGGIYGLFLDFSWSPSETGKNAILGGVGSFEYRMNTQVQTKVNIDYVFHFYNPNLGYSFFAGIGEFIVDNTNGDWESASFKITTRDSNNWIYPNLNEYSMRLSLQTYNTQIFIRNVNLMLLVIDG